MSDPHRLRRLAAGTSLLVAPVLYVAGVIADPALRQGGDTTGVYGRFHEQVSVSASLLHWSWVLLIPGIIGMIHLVRRRAVLLGHILGAVALLGVVNFSALMFGDFVYSRLERAMPPAEGEKLANEVFADPGATFGFQIPGFAGVVALLLLGLVLAYDRQVPWWAPVALVAGVFTAPIFPIGTAVGGLLYLAGSGVMGLRMLRMSQEEWNQPPARATWPPDRANRPQAQADGSPEGKRASTL